MGNASVAQAACSRVMLRESPTQSVVLLVADCLLIVLSVRDFEGKP